MYRLSHKFYKSLVCIRDRQDRRLFLYYDIIMCIIIIYVRVYRLTFFTVKIIPSESGVFVTCTLDTVGSLRTPEVQPIGFHVNLVLGVSAYRLRVEMGA